MGASDHRQIIRDSLFVMADLRLDGVERAQRVKVRNLSSGGLMVDGVAKTVAGQKAWIELRNLGEVEGSVAWVQGNRCGIAFAEEIDPKAARVASKPLPEDVQIIRRPASTLAAARAGQRLRKI
jgi:hypothetical protein